MFDISKRDNFWILDGVNKWEVEKEFQYQRLPKQFASIFIQLVQSFFIAGIKLNKAGDKYAFVNTINHLKAYNKTKRQNHKIVCYNYGSSKLLKLPLLKLYDTKSVIQSIIHTITLFILLKQRRTTIKAHLKFIIAGYSILIYLKKNNLCSQFISVIFFNEFKPEPRAISTFLKSVGANTIFVTHGWNKKGRKKKFNLFNELIVNGRRDLENYKYLTHKINYLKHQLPFQPINKKVYTLGSVIVCPNIFWSTKDTINILTDLQKEFHCEPVLRMHPGANENKNLITFCKLNNVSINDSNNTETKDILSNYDSLISSVSGIAIEGAYCGCFTIVISNQNLINQDPLELRKNNIVVSLNISDWKSKLQDKLYTGIQYSNSNAIKYIS
jgi:hypothetical protein